jgi:hypothetical protein
VIIIYLEFSNDIKLKDLSEHIDEINNDDLICFSDDVKNYIPNHVDKMPENLSAYQVIYRYIFTINLRIFHFKIILKF